MATKKKKQLRRQRRHAQRSIATDPCEYSTRFLCRADTINEQDRSVEILLTTETPVEMFDFDRFEVIPEVLLTNGAELPSSRQVPLLDSHSRFSTQTQLGSIRNLKTTDEGIVGRAVFSSLANDEWTKVREGHITDVSAGYQVLERTHVPSGEKQTVAGRVFEGPVNVVTKWRIREGSITPIGADEMAKLRGIAPDDVQRILKAIDAANTKQGTETDSDRKEEDFVMDEKLRALLIERGMPKDHDDEAAQKWLVDNKDTAFARQEDPAVGDPATVIPDVERAGNDGANSSDGSPVDMRALANLVTNQIDEREKKRAEERKRFVGDVDASLELAFGETIPGGIREECLRCDSIETVRAAIVKRRKDSQVELYGANIDLSGEQPRERHFEAVRDGFLTRAITNAVATNEVVEKYLPAEKRAKGWEDFAPMPLGTLARECLLIDGFTHDQIRRLNAPLQAQAALGFFNAGHYAVLGSRASTIPAYHTTGSLSLLTQDAVNKTLLAAYGEAPATWRTVFRQAASTADFKTIHRIKMSAAPNLPVWPDNTDPAVAAFSNEEETYAIEARAQEIQFSWRLIVNDDMDSLSRTPAQMGAAAARTVNAVAWAQITSNPTMSDGQVLFLASPTGNRKRANLATGSATPTVATVGAMKNLMRQMRGLNTPEGNESDDILNITPTFIVGPGALETTIDQLVRSIADPAASGNSGIFNPTRSLTTVIEPLLDANSATAWYLFATPTMIDTVEVTFLQGQESPIANDFRDERTMSQNFTIVQTCAAKSIDHRGVQRHDGA